MSNKDRNKRSARKARAAERAARKEAQLVAQPGAASASDAASSSKAAKKVEQAKPKQSAKSAKRSEKKPGRIRSYFRDVRTELHRVTWPSSLELRNYTLAVIVMLVVFGVCIWLVDTGFVALIAGFTGLRG
ncbi:MAG: preprotein translocase subunit SecE [Atopobiaceae bacterium]|jgi:preprotein translocase subunit SecE|nr:preprotein translocase subunit SecE [Atopobiaceae bacterium]